MAKALNAGQGQPLQEAFAVALPIGTTFTIRYVHTHETTCEPLFSPLPGRVPEQTKLKSHFLTVSTAHPGSDTPQDAFAYAIEILAYTTSRLTTLFVSKADSTGYLPQARPSSIKIISTVFLEWLTNRELAHRPGRKLVISLFGRAQGQYLFPGSVENRSKHVLDDRQLIKWWVRVLDPLFTSHKSDAGERRGFITVPGYQGLELRQFLPAAREHWSAGNPLRELALTRDISVDALTRCLLPRFPDDPKARFMQDLDDEVGLTEDAGALAAVSPRKSKNGRWKSIHNLDRFWEAMEFRQECSSGRVVGFLWVVIGDEKPIVSTLSSSRGSRLSPGTSTNPSKKGKTPVKSREKKKLTGVIVTRPPRIKGSHGQQNKFDGNGVYLSSEGYDQAMQTLLHLDFANINVAVKSTSKWVAEIASISGLPMQHWTLEVHGQAKTETITQNSITGSTVNDLSGTIKKKRVVEPAEAQPVNLLGDGLIRKKPKRQD